MVTQILGLKTTQQRNISLLFRFQWQKLKENLRFWKLFVSAYLLLIPQIELRSWCCNLMYNDASCPICSVMLIIWFYLKKIWKTKVLPHLSRYLSSFFVLQKLWRLIYSDVIGNCMSSKWFKTTNCKILHLSFSKFLRQSVAKLIRKTAIWTISCFYPLPFLNNVKKQWAKLAPSCVMGCQRCIGDEEGIFKHTFKIPVIFCHWL